MDRSFTIISISLRSTDISKIKKIKSFALYIQLQVCGSSDPSPQSWSPSQNQLLGMQRPLRQENCEDEQLPGWNAIAGTKPVFNKHISFIFSFVKLNQQIELIDTSTF